MKKVQQKLSRKRSVWLREKLERARKKKIFIAQQKTRYRSLRRYQSSRFARQSLERHMSHVDLERMGDALERMFARDERQVYHFGR